jgi:hypothetical protein
MPFAKSMTDVPGKDGQEWKVASFSLEGFGKAVNSLLKTLDISVDR